MPSLRLATGTFAICLALMVGRQSAMGQNVIHTGESETRSVQHTREAAGPRSAEQVAQARALLRQLHPFLYSDDVFNPERAADALGLVVARRSGRVSPSPDAPELGNLGPGAEPSRIASAAFMVFPERSRAPNGNELRIALTSERFGCITLADMEAVFGSGYEASRQLPFQPPGPVEIPIDVAVYQAGTPLRRAISFSYHFLDCLGGINVWGSRQQ